MKHILGTHIYNIEALQTVVVEKLRILGFEDVSESSIIEDDTHRELYMDAIEANILNIKILWNEHNKILNQLKKIN